MNNTRRKLLTKALEHLRAAEELVEEAYEQEQKSADAMGEGNFAGSEQHGTLEENASTLEAAKGEVETIVSSIGDIIEKLEDL